MIEKRDSDTGAILFKKSPNEMRLDRLEEDILVAEFRFVLFLMHNMRMETVSNTSLRHLQ